MAPQTPTRSANDPRVELTFDPPGPVFRISLDDSMPAIRVTATVFNVVATDLAALRYNWRVALVMKPVKVPLAEGRIVMHPPISVLTQGPVFTIPFTKIRGGDLSVSVSVNVGKDLLKAESQGLLILGSALPISEQMLLRSGASDTMVQIIRVESRTRQFESRGLVAGYPLFSGDKLGGVGLTQITYPRPTDDEIWSWKANLAGGMKILNSKLKSARQHLEAYPQSAKFKRYVREYNEARARKAAIPLPGALPGPVQPPPDLQITLPAPTEEQIRREGIRAFNGYGPGIIDPDAAPPKPHHKPQREYLFEHNATLDRADPQNPVLVVQEQKNAATATASWYENTKDDRLKWWRDHSLLHKNKHGKETIPGDPDYVSHVLNSRIINP